MSWNRSQCVGAAFALIVATPLMAEEPKTKGETPEDVAKRAVAALKEDRLDDFAKAMHPEALKSFKAALVSIAEVADKGGQGKEILGLFKGVDDLDELKKLDDVPFFVFFYRGITRVQPALKQALAGAESQIIGHVLEGKDTAHVVHRMTVTVDGTKVSKTDVISLKKTDTGWGMLLSGDLENMTTMLKRRFGLEKK
jgi:hypothetical protein